MSPFRKYQNVSFFEAGLLSLPHGSTSFKYLSNHRPVYNLFEDKIPHTVQLSVEVRVHSIVFLAHSKFIHPLNNLQGEMRKWLL